MNYNETLSGLFGMYCERFIEQATKNQDRETFPYIITHTGKKFRHLDPRPEDICIEDIAHALSRLCRYTGHVDAPMYSVAQHSVLVSMQCDPKDALWGLLHDASEAYLADISSPFKKLPGMEVYRFYEKKAQDAVADAFGLPHEIPESVHLADKQVATTEMRDLFTTPVMREWAMALPPNYPYPPFAWHTKGWDTTFAKFMFLESFHQLTPGTCWHCKVAMDN